MKIELQADELTINHNGKKLIITKQQLLKYAGIERDDFIEPEMVEIKKDIAILGSNEDSDNPRHFVQIVPFEIGKFCVTNREYILFDSTHTFEKGQEDYPVINVSWNNADNYAKWLSKKSGKQYRLPTETEWEYCALTSKRDFERYKEVQFGNENSLGIVGMLGNVWQWCSDYHNKNSFNQERILFKSTFSNREGDYRVIRGGSWVCDASFCRAAYRLLYAPTFRFYALGFRLARSV